MRDKYVQQAWREKIALVFIILLLCLAVGFLTFGFTETVCGKKPKRISINDLGLSDVVLLGRVLDVRDYRHPIDPNQVPTGNLTDPKTSAGSRDISFMFRSKNVKHKCDKVLSSNSSEWSFPCQMIDRQSNLVSYFDPACHYNSSAALTALQNLPRKGYVYYNSSQLQNTNNLYMVYNGQVLDLKRLKYLNTENQHRYLQMLKNPKYRGSDITYLMSQNNEKKRVVECMLQTLKVGLLDGKTIGCVITDTVLYVSLMFIVGVVLVRFVMAVLFGWVLSWRLGNFRELTAEERREREDAIEEWSQDINLVPYSRTPRRGSPASSKVALTPALLQRSHQSNQSNNPSLQNVGTETDPQYQLPAIHANNSGSTLRNASSPMPNRGSIDATASVSSVSSNTLTNSQGVDTSANCFNFKLLHTILLVTCYSEGELGLRTTLDSLAATDYPSSHKLILCIADGIICGAGSHGLSTPQICLSMMTDFVDPPNNVPHFPYIAIADGKKRHNLAKIYAGYYKYAKEDGKKQQRVPMITIVKIGDDEEKEKKPGNRGKRDSQVILMSFLMKVINNERMTPLEYEFFNAIKDVTGVTPDHFEAVLMVDADTKVFPDSVTRMVACMANDPNIIGICGETRIANKHDTWVTMIQVFEYYISHHMQKAFESIFGGVTCLPGCFCMYRIKTPKGKYFVPILANPDIVVPYSENVVDTLHKKNLLLLGEDRYLSTLMLQKFPKRKMMFVPQAVCKTIVPDTFHVLLSQRRRWINSTVHNLLELLLVNDLCGTFCFSMQFVIFMELVGTVVLPAAIGFTAYLVVISFIKRPIPIIPLLLLAAVLGLPAVLILMTTRKIVYVGWMLIYLLSLPIWNFVLPVYAFWHFDDFSWGQTRVVEGEEKGDDHSRKEGEFDSSKIVLKRWEDFERERHKMQQLQQSNQEQSNQPPLDNQNETYTSWSAASLSQETGRSLDYGLSSSFTSTGQSWSQNTPPVTHALHGRISVDKLQRPPLLGDSSSHDVDSSDIS